MRSSRFQRTLASLTALLLLAANGPSSLSAQEVEGAEEGPPELGSRLLSGLRWRSIGPAVASGRIADIAVDPTNRSVWYVAASSGNVWKTANAGTTWEPIFDDYVVNTVAGSTPQGIHRALERGLEEAGAPWTTGRALPDWPPR